jgi:GNAT superfamily N-acetyltransferase
VVLAAAPVDVPAILAVIQAAYAEYAGTLEPPSGAHAETVESLAARIGRGGAALCRVGADPAGCLLFERRDDALYVGRVAVVPGQRGRGIGRLLMAFAERAALDGGLARVTLGVRLQLPQNTTFYTKLGYTISGYGTHTGFTQPTYMTMEKRLASALPASPDAPGAGPVSTGKESCRHA